LVNAPTQKIIIAPPFQDTNVALQA